MKLADNIKQDLNEKVSSMQRLLSKGSDATKILVVEDDQTLWPFWDNILRTSLMKVEVDWTTNEAEAEKLIRFRYQEEDPYDLVISDIFLEGNKTGIDLWNRYGEAAKNFIFVSGMHLSRYDFLMSLEFGYPVYLQKPLQPSKCRELIRSLVNEGPDKNMVSTKKEVEDKNAKSSVQH